MVVVAVIAILAAIALPSYESYIRKSRARTAAADLAALSLNVENDFRRKLVYPQSSEDKSNTADIHARFPGWNAATAQYFNFSIKFNADDYVLTAQGIKTLTSCDLTMTVEHSGSTATQATTFCGFSTW
ncbi:pilus assembly protein PilE [Lampropedia puyangensis]|uniref:Pilus assembly protein PilE n=1 Tax=Lampropedia puyangensis TaxID=1330072 RepID=A0A4S8EUW9_9BURK|nr:pilus assembly protein PilE [Lampropedia puyangensis]